ncbi:unnamed protein product [Adineta steineri]|uniref:Apple domain-containing protein n=1 Tax=Adineta steineri TaxID=433720 RepID=A0A819PXJ3_9BILA|nr:unnamed protein product [Adineta steineri]CAF4021264.1 unnamed protein product [Adineta steineri]
MLCAFACNQQPSCHALDYDSASKRCRLFEGDLTTGSIVSSTSATSIVGIVELFPSLFVKTHNQSCETCQDSRYEVCSTTTNTCQCRSNSYWDRSICALQLFTNDTCSQIDSCRKDQNLTCVTDSLVNTTTTTNTTSTTTTSTTTTSTATTSTTTTSTATTTITTTTSTTTTSTKTTTTTTTSTTTITYTLPSTCPVSISANQTLASFTGLSANSYSNYTLTFTAISSPRTTLGFAVAANNNNGWFLDNVSVRGLGGSNNTQLVTNGDFSGNLTGWTLLCSMSCSTPSTQGNSLVILTGCPSGSIAPCYYAELITIIISIWYSALDIGYQWA